MSVYWLIVIAVIGLGMILPQQGHYKKWYIGIMAVLHTFVCGFRYEHLTGDLMKYNAEYLEMLKYGWFSDNVLREGRNTGFYMLMKAVATITDGNFQALLFLIAVVIEVIVAIFIYRYSPKPWLSYLVWNCFGFYVFGFSTIKQALSMAFIMCAMMCIFEEKKRAFVFWTLLAATIHMPALAFLPAYWLAHRKVSEKTILGYIAAAMCVFLLRGQIVNILSSVYYEEEEFMLTQEALGGRFVMMVLLLICGVLLKGFREKRFEATFNMIVMAALFQMLSGFDNVFTRWADFYFQFVVLYIPMVFYRPATLSPVHTAYQRPVLPFNDRSIKIMVALVAVILIWYYNRTCIGVTIEYAVDDYTNFRFMWDVVK